MRHNTNEPIKYDFGCSANRRPGFIGVDINPESGADIIWDLTKPCPMIPENSADFVLTTHVMEHIPDPYQFDFLREIVRVLKPGAEFAIQVPHPGHDCAMVPEHQHWFSVQWAKDSIATFPGMCVTRIWSQHTPYFDQIKESLGLPDAVIENCFRNVCSEVVIEGYKV